MANINTSIFNPFNEESIQDSPTNYQPGNCFVYGYNQIQSIENIPDNEENINKFTEWIKSDESNVILITGDSGCGKSEFVRFCFNKLYIPLIEYDQNINTLEYDSIKDNLMYCNVNTLFNGVFKKGIVIDNYIDNITNIQLNELLHIPFSNSVKLVFIVSNYKYDDNLSKVPIIVFNKYSIESVKQIVPTVTNKQLSQYENGDVNIRDIINNIFFNSSVLKNKQYDNLELIDKFVNPKFPDDIQFSRNASIYTNTLIHENYLNIINKNTSINDISKICDLLSFSNTVKHYILKTHNWELDDYFCVIGTYEPGLLIKNNYKMYKSYKNSNKFINENNIFIEKNRSGMNTLDIQYAISKIIFPISDINNWKDTNRILEQLAKKYYIDKSKIAKYISRSYKLAPGIDNKLIRKIKNKLVIDYK